MSDQGNSMAGFGVGLLVGVAIGASLALLYAPNSGEKTRKLIKEKVGDAWEAGVDQMEESRKRANEMMGKARKQVDEVIDTAKKKFA